MKDRKRSKKPSHNVHLKVRKGNRTILEKVGCLYPNEDGKGFRQELKFPDWELELVVREK